VVNNYNHNIIKLQNNSIYTGKSKKKKKIEPEVTMTILIIFRFVCNNLVVKRNHMNAQSLSTIIIIIILIKIATRVYLIHIY